LLSSPTSLINHNRRPLGAVFASSVLVTLYLDPYGAQRRSRQEIHDPHQVNREIGYSRIG
jgi:hypothetical protein